MEIWRLAGQERPHGRAPFPNRRWSCTCSKCTTTRRAQLVRREPQVNHRDPTEAEVGRQPMMQQLRKEAFRLTREQGIGIQSALHTAPSDPQHRMEHWITFLTVANVRTERDNELKNEVGRSPQRVVSAAQPEVPFTQRQTGASHQGRHSCRFKQSERRRWQGSWKTCSRYKSCCSSSSCSRLLSSERAPKAKEQGRTSTLRARTFCHSSRFTRARSPSFTPTQRLLPAFPTERREAAKCTRKHICIGCGKANVVYDSCGLSPDQGCLS